MSPVCKARSDSIGDGAPADETEATPAMIEAGVLALSASNEDFDSKEDIVIRVYDAMIAELKAS
jgi:hypothetical protein